MHDSESGLKLSYDNAFAASAWSEQLKALRLLPLVLLMSACSSVNLSLSPYRIDVQQGNALEQESVDKLKVGLTRSQVRFLLGTPLLVDPFHTNRWDYVFNYRKAGKLTEQRRLALFFDGDVLARIEAEGIEPKGEVPEAKPAAVEKPAEKPAEPEKASVVETAPIVAPPPIETTKPEQPAPAPAVEMAAKPVEPAVLPKTEPAPVPAQTAPAQPVSSSERSLDETSVVPPLQSNQAASAPVRTENSAVSESSPEPVALQPDTNVAAIKPDAMPDFPNASAATTPEQQVVAALNAWAKAWRTRDTNGYFAAYAANFRPEGGESRADWENRRRQMLGVAGKIDLQIEGVATESVTGDQAQVSFRQFYRSGNYQEAVIKQLKFVRVDNLWLIEDEQVLAPIQVKK
jgi:outer membrane protein assembly factor BamE